VTTSCVETMCDVVFDETNSSQKEQVDLDIVDDEEAPCDALQRMAIGDVRPRDPNGQPQEQSPNDTTPPAQERDQDEHAEEDEHHDQIQKKSNDQGGGDEDDGDKGDAPPHPRVCHNVQRDHPVDNILSDIEKGVTTRSRVANFCEYYSFVSSFEPFKVEDALHDPDWVLAMHKKLNNFKHNEVWSLVERPKQNIVGTKWLFHDKKMNMVLLQGIKHDLCQKVIHKSKVCILMKLLLP
jgi:hypothetical protein